MGQHTLLLVEAVYPGEVAALRPTQLSQDIFNGTLNTFSTGHSISHVNGPNHFILIEGVALTAENFHGVHARETRSSVVEPKTRCKVPWDDHSAAPNSKGADFRAGSN